MEKMALLSSGGWKRKKFGNCFTFDHKGYSRSKRVACSFRAVGALFLVLVLVVGCDKIAFDTQPIFHYDQAAMPAAKPWT